MAHTHRHVHAEAPTVAVTRGIPASAAAVVAWLPQRLKSLEAGVIQTQRLARRKAIPRKEQARRDFERPAHAPRSPTGPPTSAVMYGRGPAWPAAKRAKKDPRPEEKGCLSANTKCIMYTAGTRIVRLCIGTHRVPGTIMFSLRSRAKIDNRSCRLCEGPFLDPLS